MKNQYLTLAKREFWEHRSLWIAPAGAAAFLLLTALAGVLFAPARVRFGGMRMDGGLEQGAPAIADKVMLMSTIGMASVIVIAACVTAGVYLLDCLYSERKDRSILFWKSLPVSDRDSVLVKFGVAMLVVPAGVFVLQFVTNLLLTGLVAMAFRGTPPWLALWNVPDWLTAQAQFAGFIVLALLWYAPVAAWLMLASVATTRAPLMFAVLPWVILTISERLVLGTTNVWHFIAWRLTPGQAPLERLASPGLWIGLAVAAGMLYLVIRLRRYRDDT
jgi:ABC-2 type transport system permease protein